MFQSMCSCKIYFARTLIRCSALLQGKRVKLSLADLLAQTSLQTQVLKSLQQGGLPCDSQLLVPTLDAELELLILSKAAQHGLPAAWVQRLANFDPERRQVASISMSA